ncbi:MAG: hypothetical protein H0T89_33590 [Deltaproteobacteria bacterium]|nr:hypothetical protein [Deltaproteobacteria bacterium]
MKNASSLPTVEHSLEEFIAKANQTLVDVSGWGEDNKQVDPARKEHDAQRWKQAEHQMRDSEVREQSLRRQLDGLQGKLAEAEARAAVAGTQMGSAAHDTTISDLKSQIDKAIQRMRSAEERSQELQQALASVKAEASAKISTPSLSNGIDEDEAAERIRLAEAKATKAIAAARAAQAGLTVSSADLAAIESGLVVVNPPAKKSPWLLVAVAFIGGLGIMFAVWKLVLDKPSKAPVAPATSTQEPAAATQPVAAPAAPAEPATPAKPVVTPIEDQPAAIEEAKVAAPVVTPIEDKPAPVEAAKPAPVETKPAATAKAEPKATKKAAAKPARPAKKAAKGTIADPFAETPAPKKPAKPAEKKPAGTIVDPF